MKLAVLGAGSWGLTLAWLLSKNFDTVSVWGRQEDMTPDFMETKIKKYPLEVTLPQKVELTTNLTEAIQDAKIILMVVSTAGTRPVCELLANSGLKDNQVIVNASKGIELPSLKTLSKVIAEVLPDNPIAVLSGPTLAGEVLKGLPTAASIACKDIEVADKLQELLSVNNKFRIYTNTDVTGVELGGSLKNVVAIASGFVDACGFGANARGAILTRGLAEIVRVGMELGANPSTLYGLSGIGDLIATCSSPLSRNYQVGYRLGQGKKLDDILRELGAIAEGVKTSKALCELSDKLNIETPLSETVYEAVFTDISIDQIIFKLMNRKLKREEIYTN
ncbi:MAG: NAD(P)-dependent glycerol-3-phosphate dehydrogenase [Candidatus Gastranaerophilales bacterium]|nr:NAD(P)-dependent glycerol-3-phosphate dehydrogenase [Candidatus Gastranaerophilales bacterium]